MPCSKSEKCEIQSKKNKNKCETITSSAGQCLSSLISVSYLRSCMLKST